MKDLVKKAGVESEFYIASAATSTEEIWRGVGNPVYPPAKAELAKHGLSCGGKRAVQIQKSDYDKYDYLIAMEQVNVQNMLRILGGDPQGKIHLLLEYTGENRGVADPWYTGNFALAYDDILRGCKAFFETL
jgi:protein-tyrosine phosphatase